MFGLAKVFGFDSRTSRRHTRRRRSFRASIEAVEDRALMFTLSAINWTSGGQEHTAVFAIESNSVYEDKDGTGWVQLPGVYALQISAGLDANNNPEVYAIDQYHGLDVNDFNGAGWHSLGGYAKQISASDHNLLYYIGSDDAVYWYSGGQGASLGGIALDISAGKDASGRPEVYAIGDNNSLCVNDDFGGWQVLGGYAKQISATTANYLYYIGSDNAVWWYSGGYGGRVGGSPYALEISAGLDANGKPEVYAIGQYNALSVNDDFGNWQGLGGYVREIAAPSFGDGLPGNQVYAVGLDHAGELYSNGFVSLGGYLQLPEDPGTLSAISFGSGTLNFTAVFAIGTNDQVYVDEPGTDGFTLLGGMNALQISAGLDAYGQPEVYAIGLNHALYVYDLSAPGWFDLGGYAKQISASADNTVYYIGGDDSVYSCVLTKITPTTYAERGADLGGYALQVSAGLDASGHPEVWAIGTDYNLCLNDGGGWVQLGGWVKQISATAHNTVYAIGIDDSVFKNSGGGYVGMGGYALADQRRVVRQRHSRGLRHRPLQCPVPVRQRQRHLEGAGRLGQADQRHGRQHRLRRRQRRRGLLQQRDGLRPAGAPAL